MRNFIKRVLGKYFNKDLELNVRLFNLLAIGGIAVSIISALHSILGSISVLGGIINFSAAVCSYLLMYFVHKTRKYTVGFISTVVGVFMGLFGVLFFSMGGITGSMPYFFIFAIVFTFLTLQGKLLYFIVSIQIIYYIGICILAYQYPEMVTPFESPRQQLFDLIIGFVLSGLSLGIIFFAYIQTYRVQQRIVEEAKRTADKANAAKSDFLANMSHEIRTPINLMLGMNEMILRESETEQVLEYARNVQNAGEQLLLLVNQVLDFSKIESGKMEVVENTYDIRELIHELFTMGKIHAEKKNLKFELELDENLPLKLYGDEKHIHQIIINLISNAIKYTRTGIVTLSVVAIPESVERILLEVTVTDTGIGIKEKDLPFLFNSFERVDINNNRSIEGSGLGLTIINNLLDMIGGTILVDSIYGSGSTFKVTIPQGVVSSETLKSEKEEAVKMGEETFVAPEGRILVVDDNYMNLAVIKSLLKRTRLQVDTATGGEECLDMIQSEYYHVILMDYMMPEMDGLETLQQIQDRSDHVCTDTPVIVLTANVIAGTKEMLIGKGFKDYLSKPVRWQELEGVLMKYLPPSLITRTRKAENKGNISEEEIRSYSLLLRPYDIILEDGLHYMSGDIYQYAKTADFFRKTYERARKGVEKYLDTEEIDKLCISIHALKGNARGIGAIDLHYIARRLEKRCHDRDVSYVKQGKDLLFLEWERAVSGISEFLSVSGILSKAESASDEAISIRPLDANAYMERILAHIEVSEAEPALLLIKELVKSPLPEHTLLVLRAASEFIEEIEFDEAGNILRKELANGRKQNIGNR